MRYAWLAVTCKYFLEKAIKTQSFDFVPANITYEEVKLRNKFFTDAQPVTCQESTEVCWQRETIVNYSLWHKATQRSESKALRILAPGTRWRSVR